MSSGDLFSQIDKRVELPPISVGNRTIQPIAQIKGWYGSADSNNSGGAGAGLRMLPTEVIVREDDTEYAIAIRDPLQGPLRQLIGSAIVLAVLCSLAIVIVDRIAKHKINA